MPDDERREKPPEGVYRCPGCGEMGVFEFGLVGGPALCGCPSGDYVLYVPRSLSGLASILQGLDEDGLAEASRVWSRFWADHAKRQHRESRHESLPPLPHTESLRRRRDAELGGQP